MFLFDQVVASHGVPSFILTDQGSNFTSSYVSSFMRRLECRHLTTTAYRPQTNGLVERMNQTVVQALNNIVRDKDDKHNWDKYLTAALLAIRTTPNDTTNLSPAMLLYGMEMRTTSTWPTSEIRLRGG
jgi:transposase InsO family protein